MPSAAQTATFSAQGYGSRTTLCTGLSFGTSIEGEESESREHSTFYPTRVTSGSFSVDVAFPTHALWREFIEWMERYARAISNPNGTVGPMVVSIPFRGFSKVAIPTTGFQYGDKTGQLVRRSTISFEGANDPLKPGQRGTSSEPVIPGDDIVKTFYPTGFQAGGRTEDALYNGAPPSNGGDVRLEALARDLSSGGHAALNELNQRNGGPTSNVASTGDNAGGEYD